MSSKTAAVDQEPDGPRDLTPEEALADQRSRLARLIGRLLARHWLRSQADQAEVSASSPPAARIREDK